MSTHVTGLTIDATAEVVEVSLATILAELRDTAGRLDPAEVEAAARHIGAADRIFLLGQGRSAIALQAFAMRLMHLGLETHVIGEVTAPAVREGDVVVVASGSGTTESVVRSARKASGLGATLIVFTSDPSSPLAALGTAVVTVSAAVKTDHSEARSRQYAGSLFEQSVFLLGDAIFDALWHRSSRPAEELWTRHANLE
ncbi:6-phospho-3-hexuloisomerase [Corynebacterium variabile]|uniref:6-phospho-3-hexuloisomerase n=1 Tax=Corynebacterium variabile TaxID=1727 RepID=UPI0028983613|nr:6-phospho-3-hexuloisomerase [Corynebacterium variabile]